MSPGAAEGVAVCLIKEVEGKGLCTLAGGSVCLCHQCLAVLHPKVASCSRCQTGCEL